MIKAIPTVRVADIPRVLSSFIQDRAKACLWLAERYGDVVKLPAPGKNIVLVSSPAGAKHVLLDHYKNYKKSWDYAILSELLGQGLITADGDAWFRSRRVMQPLFSNSMMEEFSHCMNRRTVAMVHGWRNGLVNISAEITTLTLGIIGERLFSDDVAAHAAPIARDLDLCQQQVIRRSMAPIDFSGFMPTFSQWRFSRALKRLDERMGSFIAKRRAGAEQRDLLGLLLGARDPETGDGLTDQQVRDEVLTMFFAGFETTTVGLSWALYLLAQHPQIMNRVRDEAAKVLGNRDLTYPDLASLTYTRQVVDEALRMYSPVVIFGRETLQADEVAGYRVDTGTQLAFCPHAIHHHSAYWSNPSTFDPDRFSEANKAKMVKYQYLPFGAGPRACIGAQFAVMEMQMAIALIVRDVTLTLPKGRPLKAKPFISYRPSRPMVLKVERT